MAEVKWQARRIDDGVLVDITGDTESTPQGAPTPNALEAGSGEQTITLRGPYTINWNTANIESPPGVKLLDLPTNSMVIKFMAFPTTIFDGAVNPAVIPVIGIPDDGTPGRELTAASLTGGGTSTGGGYTIDRETHTIADYSPLGITAVRERSGLPLSLWVYISYDSGTLTAGSAAVYVMYAEPAA